MTIRQIEGKFTSESLLQQLYCACIPFDELNKLPLVYYAPVSRPISSLCVFSSLFYRRCANNRR